MIIQHESSRLQGCMVWAGISPGDKTILRLVELGIKINTDYYIHKILKPFLLRNIPRLFRRNTKKKTVFHQDNTHSRVSKKAIAFLDALKINYFKPEEWTHKSPDTVPIQVNLTPSDPIGIRRNPWYRIPTGYRTILTLSNIQPLPVGI